MPSIHSPGADGQPGGVIHLGIALLIALLVSCRSLSHLKIASTIVFNTGCTVSNAPGFGEPRTRAEPCLPAKKCQVKLC